MAILVCHQPRQKLNTADGQEEVMMPKRIILCFDGTWNKLDDNTDESQDIETNVCRFYESVAPQSDHDGWAQQAWYDKGVGTRWYERIRGGAFGRGLDKNILQGYAYLTQTYTEGDDIYLFGFSRGAYTARSLVGLIRNSGLVRRDHLPSVTLVNRSAKDIEGLLNPLLEHDLIEEAYDLYRTRDEGPDTPTAQSFRQSYSKEVPIKFLGVWDTVGALGIPHDSFEWFNKRKYQFHDSQLSGIVEHAYHAAAVDEHRGPYKVTLWEPTEPVQNMEQRWFIGAHSDVGGGYKDRRLSDIPLRWMQEKAMGVGLTLNRQMVPDITPSHYLEPEITDSYSKFVRGLWKLRHERYYRPIGRVAHSKEVVDPSVFQRIEHDPGYRPQNEGLLEQTEAPAK